MTIISQQPKRWTALAAFCLVLSGSALAQGTAMNEPDDTKPVQLSGCMTARTADGLFVLSGVFGPPVKVLGPNYLQIGLGHQVTLTGTWQAVGISPSTTEAQKKVPRMFVASKVKVTGKQCASPPSAQEEPPKTSDKN